MFSKYISGPLFFTSFVIGLVFIYFLGPEQKTIYIYPNLQNYMSVQYKDNADQCFMFKPVATACPINPLEIKTAPIQG
jgi:hypothetical protein